MCLIVCSTKGVKNTTVCLIVCSTKGVKHTTVCLIICSTKGVKHTTDIAGICMWATQLKHCCMLVAIRCVQYARMWFQVTENLARPIYARGPR